jgi:aryl-alcohol dehydrogenase-like predicted oxidoreductase
MRSFEDSLQRLGLARIDILYVHDIGAYQHPAAAPQHMQILRDSGYRALENLKRSGAVDAIGIGVNEREVLLEAVEWGEWDAFLLAGRYTLLEQAPVEDLYRNASRAASRSPSAGRSIRASWPGATPGTMTRHPRRSRRRRKRSVRSANGTACRCQPRPCNFRWRTRPSRRSSRGPRDTVEFRPT